MCIADLHVAMLRINVTAPVGVLKPPPLGLRKTAKPSLGLRWMLTREQEMSSQTFTTSRLLPHRACYYIDELNLLPCLPVYNKHADLLEYYGFFFETPAYWILAFLCFSEFVRLFISLTQDAGIANWFSGVSISWYPFLSWVLWWFQWKWPY